MTDTPTSEHGGGGVPQSLGSWSGGAALPSWTTEHAMAASEATLGRLRALGIRLPPDNRLERAARLIVTGASGPRVVEAHRTVFEQYFIAAALRSASTTLRERLAWLLSG